MKRHERRLKKMIKKGINNSIQGHQNVAK
jgi:hypothetical protein